MSFFLVFSFFFLFFIGGMYIDRQRFVVGFGQAISDEKTNKTNIFNLKKKKKKRHSSSVFSFVHSELYSV